MKEKLLKVWNVVKSPLTCVLNIVKRVLRIVIEEVIVLLQTINTLLD
jgi:hypothetical protein